MLAIFITWHEAKRGSKYGINTIKRTELKGLTIPEGDISKSSPYEAVNYYMLETLFENFRKLFPEEKSLTDLGCGKGRVLVVAAHYGFTDITGIDFAKELCEEAARNVKSIKTDFPAVNFKIIWDDVIRVPLTAINNVFFLFNPFNKEILEKFVEKVEQSLQDHPRAVYFIYVNPKHADVLLKKNFKVVYHVKKMKFLEGLIAIKRAG